MAVPFAAAGFRPPVMAGGLPRVMAGEGHDRGAAGTVPAAHNTLMPARLAQAARNFEALTIGQLFQPMFDTVDTAHGLFGGGDAEAAWKPMLVDAIATQFAARGGLGLAGPVFRALLRAQEARSRKTPS